MNWIKLKDAKPTHYECVFAKLKTGDIVEVWGAWSENVGIIYTVFETREIIYPEDIEEWRSHPLEEKYYDEQVR